MRLPPPSGPREILVVDDDEHTRNLLRDLCESAGYTVALAADGEAPFRTYVDRKPDLVLLDVMMPHKDGFAVLKEIRDDAAWASVSVVILTANGDMDGKIRGMELGADDFITKPFKIVDLQTRISSALLVRDYRHRLAVAEEELAQLRALDPVTGAGTYAQLKASLDAEVSRSRRYGRPAAVLMFGFEDYQGLRYQLGRERCDGYIAELARELRRRLRGADRLFRLEVDEFVLLLPETDLEGSKIAADRVLALIRELTPEGRDGRFEPRVRIGGAVFPQDHVRSSEDLLREANRVFRASSDPL